MITNDYYIHSLQADDLKHFYLEIQLNGNNF